MLTKHTERKSVQRRKPVGRPVPRPALHTLASVATENDLTALNENDPPDKPAPGPDLPPPSRPVPGTPKPGDPPGQPRPGDPSPDKPQPDSPRPVRPKSVYLMTMISFLAGMFASSAAAERIDDDDVLEAIETELRYDDAISADRLDVQVDAGIVTLSGTTFTLLAKRRASQLIGSLKGVRAIVDRTQVASGGRTDDRVRSDVKDALRDDPVADENEIRVELENGRVTLSGTVDSFAEAQIAEETIAGVRDVVEIDNQLQIDEMTKRPANEIRAEILRRFELDPFLAEGLIRLAVQDAKVTLSGVVGSANEKNLAAMLSYVAGVREVDADALEVKWWLDRERRREKFTVVRNDIDIQTAVKDALLYDPRVKGADVRVRVRQAAVSLLGEVGSLSAKRAAEHDAMNTLGVRRVINHLKVKHSDWPGDLKLSEQAQDALARDAHLFDVDLRASSHFGKVYLTGTVDTHFEKQRAEEVIANVPGALDVVNRLVVDAPWQPKPDDEIREDAERRLHWSPVFDDGQIQVTVNGGVSTLHGTVYTWQERRLAEQHALQGGARRVVNKLEVRAQRIAPLGLKATLIPNETEYELDPRTQGERFRRFVELAKPAPNPADLPPVPKVDLVFQLRNETDQSIDVRLGHDRGGIQLSLTGEGAVHVTLGRSFPADFRPGRVITIKPGEDFAIPIRSLQYGFRNASDRWYWTEPGEYKLQATLEWPVGTIGINSFSISASPITLTVNAPPDKHSLQGEPYE